MSKWHLFADGRGWLCAVILALAFAVQADQDVNQNQVVQPGQIPAQPAPTQPPPAEVPPPQPPVESVPPQPQEPPPPPIFEKPSMGPVCAPGCMPEGQAEENNAPVCQTGCVAKPQGKAKIQYGSGEFINKEAADRQPTVDESGGAATFNFENEAIQVVVKTILGDLLQQNYVISPDVNGTVTFATPRPINSDQAMAVLEMLLSWNNATLVRKEGRYIVLPIARAIPGNLSPRTVTPKPGDGYQVVAVPLKYISATAMQELLKPYAKAEAVIRADNARSLLVLAGIAGDLRTYLDTIEVFDVDWLKGMSVGIYPLERIEAKDVLPELEKIFGDGGPTPLAGMFRFMPIERLNAVMVITPQPEYLDTAEEWLGKLDRGGSDAGPQLFVYYVQNVKATDLAENLTEIFGGGGGGKRSSSTPQGGVTPGMDSVEIKAMNNPRGGDAAKRAAPSTASSGGISVMESESIRISAIEESNSLLIKATPNEYNSIERAIKRLDTVPLQVHIEAKVIRVDLEDQFRFGVKYAFQNNLSNGSFSNGVPFRNVRPRTGWRSAAGALDSALTWTFLSSGVDAFVDTLQLHSKSQILASPSLVVLNNKEASINVGKQIPVVSTYFNPGFGGVVNNPNDPNNGGGANSGFFNQSSVQFRDTGIIFNVKPRVNPGGLVFLEIKQENSKPGADADATGNVPVDKTTLETEVAVQSGQTIVLGGLISEDKSTGRTGVPGLSRIPLIGGLFGNSTNNGNRQELVLMLTPTVIENAQDAERISDEYQLRFRNLRPLIRKMERQEERVDRMIEENAEQERRDQQKAQEKAEKKAREEAEAIARAEEKAKIKAAEIERKKAGNAKQNSDATAPKDQANKMESSAITTDETKNPR